LSLSALTAEFSPFFSSDLRHPARKGHKTILFIKTCRVLPAGDEMSEKSNEMAALLRGMGARELLENAPSDFYWGCGRDGTGKNRLRVLLMELRTELRVNNA
jgi:predicted NAD-dependent protein-ADP-ribosyltransferase YbiA (DUF1768 family)